MPYELRERDTKEFFRQMAYRCLEEYGPNVLCIFMNTEDRMEWEAEHGEDIDPGIDGFRIVDDFKHPRQRCNPVFEDAFYDWQRRSQLGYSDYVAPTKRGRRREIRSESKRADRLQGDEEQGV